MEFRFEFDDRKSGSNKKKDKIDFVEAQALWLDPELVMVTARAGDEPRYVAIGRVGDKHWSAVFTYRSESLRLISVRRSRPKEVALYESQ